MWGRSLGCTRKGLVQGADRGVGGGVVIDGRAGVGGVGRVQREGCGEAEEGFKRNRDVLLLEARGCATVRRPTSTSARYSYDKLFWDHHRQQQ